LLMKINAMRTQSIIFILSLFFLPLIGCADSVSTGNDTTIVFEETTHNFGNIILGSNVTYSFKFKNVSSEEIILLDVRSTCHNMSVDWPREELPKGKTAELKISFKAAEITTFRKKIFVYSTASPSPMVLTIKGNIINKK